MTSDRALLWEQSGVRLISFADIVGELMQWLWPGRIPLGMITLLNGDPEAAKSLITIDLAARLTTGEPMPSETTRGEPSNVLFMAAEDHPAMVIRPRLDAARADVARVHLIEAVKATDGTDEPPMLSTRGVQRIDAAIRETNAKLFVIDPLMNHLPSDIDSNKDQEVRSVLSPLATVARQTNCAVLIVRHHTKASKGAHRGEGSIGIKGIARVELTASKPTGHTSGSLRVTKSNIGPYPSELSYNIEGDVAPRLRWNTNGVNRTGTSEALSVIEAVMKWPGLKPSELAERMRGNKSTRLAEIRAAVKAGAVELRGGNGETKRGAVLHVAPTG